MSFINQLTLSQYGVEGRSRLKGSNKGPGAHRVQQINTLAALAYNPIPQLCYCALLFLHFYAFYYMFFLIRTVPLGGCAWVVVPEWLSGSVVGWLTWMVAGIISLCLHSSVSYAHFHTTPWSMILFQCRVFSHSSWAPVVGKRGQKFDDVTFNYQSALLLRRSLSKGDFENCDF